MLADESPDHGAFALPFGHVWLVSTKKDQLAAREVEDRFAKMMRV